MCASPDVQDRMCPAVQVVIAKLHGRVFNISWVDKIMQYVVRRDRTLDSEMRSQCMTRGIIVWLRLDEILI